MTGIIRPGTGSRGAFFLQPGDPGFQVAYPLAKTMQLGSHALVRAADVAEESLRHDGGSSYLGETDSMPSHAVANQYLAASPPSAFGPLRIEPWAYWLLVDLAPVLAMAAFHRDAPPVPRRAWLAVLPAGLVLAAVPLFVIQVTHSALTLQDPAGLFCILIAAAGLLRLLLA